MNYSLNNGLYCTEWVHSHIWSTIWSTIALTEKFNNGLCTYFSQLCGLKTSRNSSQVKA